MALKFTHQNLDRAIKKDNLYGGRQIHNYIREGLTPDEVYQRKIFDYFWLHCMGFEGYESPRDLIVVDCEVRKALNSEKTT